MSSSLEASASILPCRSSTSTSPSTLNPVMPFSPYLPRRQITVFGLESSGTTFLTKLLARAASVYPLEGTTSDIKGLRALKRLNRTLEVAHLSLPWGGICEPRSPNSIVKALYPPRCIARIPSKEIPNECVQIGVPFVEQGEGAQMKQAPIPYPERYFVNITSHVEWYRQRGVDATAVIIVRDATISAQARRKNHHCLNAKFSKREEATGRMLINEAIQKLPNMYQGSASSSPPLVIVSYETMNQLGAPYLNFILQMLNIPPLRGYHLNQTTFSDGNVKYINAKMPIRPRNSNPEGSYNQRLDFRDNGGIRRDGPINLSDDEMSSAGSEGRARTANRNQDVFRMTEDGGLLSSSLSAPQAGRTKRMVVGSTKVRKRMNG